MLPPAWDDPATRSVTNKQVKIAIILFVLALIAALGTVAVAYLGYLAEPWGLPVMVAAAGVAGGALAGAITMFVLWSSLRSFLRSGPWEPGQLTLAEGRYATLSFGRRLAEVRLDVGTAGLGEVGDRVAVEVRSDGEPYLITLPHSRRMIRARTSDQQREDDDRA